MAEAAVPLPRRRIELPVSEARLRFLQLVRLADVAKQITVLVDRGTPAAAIVPLQVADAAFDPPAPMPEASAAGWIRRVETLREDLRRKHAARTDELQDALDESWQLIDALRPPGVDRGVDAVRAAHAQLRRRS
ncbi:hypothetical protein ACWKSP_13435 [Micromonosporaceae bacterium Da 78-11]